jgi:hypothetical protein
MVFHRKIPLERTWRQVLSMALRAAIPLNFEHKYCFPSLLKELECPSF